MADFKAPGQHTYMGTEMPGGYPPEILDRVPDFEYRPDDVLIATYPKSGTTWMQQIVSLILSDDAVNTSRNQPLNTRSPMLEIHTKKDEPPSIDTLSTLQSPRVIKTHLDYRFFKKPIETPGKPQFKTIVVMRNVRDCLVSYYYYYKINGRTKFDGDFNAFFELFKVKGLVVGDYFDHALSWWEARNNPNIKIVKYEDLKKDLRGEIMKVASFLGKTLSDTQLDGIVMECSFESMKTNPMTNNERVPNYKMGISKFMRKGEIGDWQNHLTEDQVGYLDSRCEQELTPNGLVFEYM